MRKDILCTYNQVIRIGAPPTETLEEVIWPALNYAYAGTEDARNADAHHERAAHEVCRSFEACLEIGICTDGTRVVLGIKS